MLKLVEVLARLMAVLGGLVLTVLIALVCLSVLGRGGNTFGHSDFLTGIAPGFADWLIATGIGPITGDFELVEAGIAFAIFAFLPLCQLYGGHATVDIFTSKLPTRLNAMLIAFWEVVLAAAILLIAWRLFEGMQDKMRFGETTFLLQFPVWWAYAASFAAAVVAALVAVYCAVARVLEATTAGVYLPRRGEAQH